KVTSLFLRAIGLRQSVPIPERKQGMLLLRYGWWSAGASASPTGVAVDPCISLYSVRPNGYLPCLHCLELSMIRWRNRTLTQSLPPSLAPTSPPSSSISERREGDSPSRLRFDRAEMAGAVADLGVFVPIAVALIVKN